MYNTTIASPTPRPLSLEGRLGRLSFIAWMVFFHVLMSAIAVLGEIALSIVQLSFSEMFATFSSSFLSLYSLFLLAFSIAYFYGILVITVRRLHDTGHRGWWMLCGFIPVLNILLLLYLMLRSGSSSANHYGIPRPTSSLEKLTAWIVIIFTVLSFGWLWSVVQWFMGHTSLDLPQDMLQKSTEYF